MIATLLLLAQMPFFFTADTVQTPRGQYSTTFNMPTQVSPYQLPDDLGYIESQRIGQPEFFQRNEYTNPGDGGYPIRTVVPRQFQQTRPIEQEMAIREEQSQQMQRDVSLQKSLLDQKIQASEYQYHLNTLKQGEELISHLPELNPDAEDYLAQRAQLSKKFPLGVQHQPVARQLELLDNTHQQVTKYNDSLKQRAAEQEAKEAANLRKAEITQGRTILSKYNDPGLLAQFEELAAKDPNASPLAVSLKVAQGREQQSRISQLQELGVDPKQFYTPNVNGETTFDVRRADALIRTYPTSSNAAQSAATMQKISENQSGTPYEDWDVNTKAIYDFHGSQLQRYQALTGQKSQEQPKIRTVESYFNGK